MCMNAARKESPENMVALQQVTTWDNTCPVWRIDWGGSIEHVKLRHFWWNKYAVYANIQFLRNCIIWLKSPFPSWFGHTTSAVSYVDDFQHLWSSSHMAVLTYDCLLLIHHCALLMFLFLLSHLAVSSQIRLRTRLLDAAHCRWDFLCCFTAAASTAFHWHYVHLSIEKEYVHLSRNMHVNYVRLGRNLYIHYVRLRPHFINSNLNY